MLTAVFIDGGYLDRGSRGEHRLDYNRLANMLAGEERLLQTYYYNCLPFDFKTPAPDQEKFYKMRMQFYDNLKRHPKLTCKFGYLVYRGRDTDGKPILVQKKVDVMLAVDMITMAARRILHSIKLLSGDSDLSPAIQETRQFGIRVDLFTFEALTYAGELASECDTHTILTPEMMGDLSNNN